MAQSGHSHARVTVFEADPARDVGTVASLFREYAESLPSTAQCSLVHQGFEAELAALPGRYARPAGCMLLALLEKRPVGVVALREIAALPGEQPRICEMKRMYIRPAARGLGLGRLLGQRLIDEARAIGYRTMKLDTEPDFAPAVSLYHSLGFREIPRYNDDPVSCTLYMGRDLGATTIPSHGSTIRSDAHKPLGS